MGHRMVADRSFGTGSSVTSLYAALIRECNLYLLYIYERERVLPYMLACNSVRQSRGNPLLLTGR